MSEPWGHIQNPSDSCLTFHQLSSGQSIPPTAPCPEIFLWSMELRFTIVQCLRAISETGLLGGLCQVTYSGPRPCKGWAKSRCSVSIICRKGSLMKVCCSSVLHQHQHGLQVATMVDDLNNRNSFSQNGSPETQTKALQSQTCFKSPRPAPSLPLPASGHLQLSIHLQLASFLCLLCLSLTLPLLLWKDTAWLRSHPKAKMFSLKILSLTISAVSDSNITTEETQASSLDISFEEPRVRLPVQRQGSQSERLEHRNPPPWLGRKQACVCLLICLVLQQLDGTLLVWNIFVQHRLALNPCLSLPSVYCWLSMGEFTLDFCFLQYKINCIKVLFSKYLITMLNLVFIFYKGIPAHSLKMYKAYYKKDN